MKVVRVVVNDDGTVADYITSAEAAKNWGVNPSTIDVWRRRGKLPNTIKLGGARLIPLDAEKPHPIKGGRPRKETRDDPHK